MFDELPIHPVDLFCNLFGLDVFGRCLPCLPINDYFIECSVCLVGYMVFVLKGLITCDWLS